MIQPPLAIIWALTSVASSPAEIEDGVYVIQRHGNRSAEVRRPDGTSVVLGSKICDLPDTATIESTVNDNSLCRLRLLAGPFARDISRRAIAISVAGVFLEVQGTSPRGDSAYLDADIEGETQVTKVANRLKVIPNLRRHPGHQMAVRWTTVKASYRPRESVQLRLVITNVGRTSIRFTEGTPAKARNNQFGFTAYRRGDGSAVPDTGDPDDSGLGLSGEVTLDPGEKFEATVDLSAWFEFKDPGTYRVTGFYRMELKNTDRRTVWNDFAASDVLVRIEDR